MKWVRRIAILLLIIILLTAAAGAGLWLYLDHTEWGFAREVSAEEAALRNKVVTTAESWLGANEDDGTHKAVIDLYNSHEPLAQGYEVQYSDNWCSTFASSVAIACGLTDIIPTECGCQRHIGLFDEIGCWEEYDGYMPLPGDYIFYCKNCDFSSDCTSWSSHVGIVVGTCGPFIKVIEGNKGDAVDYRIIVRNDPQIRGYGTPDYAGKCE